MDAKADVSENDPRNIQPTTAPIPKPSRDILKEKLSYRKRQVGNKLLN